MPVPQTSQQELTKLALAMYFDAIQQWNKSFDKAKQATHHYTAERHPARIVSEAPAVAPKSVAVRAYNGMIENQMARCRFAEQRFSQYLGLPEAAAACKSPLDVLALQTSFVKKAFNDYALEGARMMSLFWPWSQRSV